MNKWILGSSILALAAAAALPSCVEKFATDCAKTRTCKDDISNSLGGGAGSGGTPDTGGAGGNAPGASGGASNGPAGAAGAANDCPSVCPSSEFCDRGSCVECSNEVPCDGDELCDDDGKCVECIEGDENAACKDATASLCDSGKCIACGSNDDCTNIPGKHVCDAGECVQCTGKQFADCGQTNGVPLVCDSLSRTCSNYKAGFAGGPCQPCVSDAHCSEGQLCVLQKFGESGEDVGYFCHWIAGDTENGAPAECYSSQGRPFVETSDVVSIDGDEAQACVLRTSTCKALNEFSENDCKSSGTGGVSGDDSLCGFDPPNDAKCDQVGSTTTYQCSVRCISSDDCPVGVICAPGSGQRYCDL